MAQANPFDQFDSQQAPVPLAQIRPIIAAPRDPNEAAQEARAEVGTGINVSSEARQGREEVRKAILDLQTRFRSDDNVKKYEGALPNYVAALKTQPTNAGDALLVYHLTKTVDPGSTVGAGDMETMSAADARIPALAQKWLTELRISNGKFTPEAREGLRLELRELLNQREQAYMATRDLYSELAQSQEFGVRPELVVGKTPFGERSKPEIEKYWKDKAQPGSQQLGLEAGATFSTEKDKAIRDATQQAWQSGADLQGIVAAAEAAGGNITPNDIANIQAAIEARAKGQSVTFNPAQTGQRSPIAQAAGEALMTPAGTALTGAVNAAGAGLLSQVAGDQVQGLEALNPNAALVGELAGSIAGTAGLARGGAAALRMAAPGIAERVAGGGLAGAIGREALTEGAYGGLYAANTGQDIGTGLALGAAGSLGGRALGAAARRVAPAVGRVLGREGGNIPPDGGVPPGGADMGGGVSPAGGMPPMGGAPAGAPSAGASMAGGIDQMAAQAEEPFAPITFRSNDAGSAGTSLETIRRSQAEGLPVQMDLTLGAATRDPEQLAFEKEQLYGALGGPLRKRAEENNLQALENFDRFIDQTGAIATENIADTGNAVISALSKGYQAAKNKVNVAYKRAENSEGAQEPVDYAELTAFINAQDEATKEIAPVLKSVQQQIAKNDPNGTGQITVATMENIRKLISKNAQQGTPSSVYGGEMKGIIDSLTEGKGGELYNKARKLRIEQARKFENRAIVARLVTNVKNMDDPKVAADEVFKKSIMNESPEDIKFLRQTLRTLGPEGRQAWSELQGATIRDIARKATSNARMTEDNRPVISASGLDKAIQALEGNGRIDEIFNPKMARQLRDLRDVVMYINTVPPGTSINNSGTARTLAAMMGEMAVTGGASAYLTGSTVPVPIVTGIKMMMKASKDREIRQKIARSLMPKE